MRSSKTALLLLSLAVAMTASADGITSVSPPKFRVGDVENFATIDGTGLVGTESTVVVFSGAAGTFEVEPNIASSTQLVVWVPALVLINVGVYDVSVKVTDTNLPPRSIGSGSLEVVAEPITGPPLLAIPEVVTAEADGPT